MLEAKTIQQTTLSISLIISFLLLQFEKKFFRKEVKQVINGDNSAKEQEQQVDKGRVVCIQVSQKQVCHTATIKVSKEKEEMEKERAKERQTNR